MKNQIQTLKRIFSFLLIVLGLNAFTSPAQQHVYDITEGKIEAVMQDTPYLSEYLKAQQDYRQMNIDFDALLRSIGNSADEDSAQISVLAQSLYIYEKDMSEVSFSSQTFVQRKALIERLLTVKRDFYRAFSEFQ